jgi:diguanylate cyclase (GGDEF)-like protein
MEPVDLRRFVHRIAIAISLTIAIVIPAFHGLSAYRHEADRTGLVASFTANELSRYAQSDGRLWQYRVARLIELIQPAHTIRDKVRQRVLSTSGRQLLADGPVQAPPILVRSAQVFAEGRLVATVEVESSLRPLLNEIGLMWVFGCLLGFLTYFTMRSFPLRVIDRAIDALERQNQRLDETLGSMSQGLCRFDADQRVVVANAKYREMFGLKPEDVNLGTDLKHILEVRRAAGSLSQSPEEYLKQNVRRLEEIQSLADGRSIRILRHPMPDGGWLATFEDITERHAIEAQIHHLAKYDALTGLANRVVLRETIEDACHCLTKREGGFCVLMLDLDRFKAVNDSVGHPGGDALLKETASRLKAVLGEGDFAARLGGDEFAILLAPTEYPRAAGAAMARTLIDVLSQPFDIESNRINIGASVGIAIAPIHGDEPVTLLKQADIALYRAKSDGRSCYRFFDPRMQTEAEAEHRLEAELRLAISRSELDLHYQPIVDVKTGRIECMEALLRWRHADLGMVPPDKFIPIAEKTGLIVPLGEWVLQRACADAANWPSHIRVAVNLSLSQFRKSNLADVIFCALVESGLQPRRLELEITESVFLSDDAEHWAVLRQLKGLGIKIALDDFGTGYSSISYLTKFPFDKLKIDKSFIQGMEENAGCAAIVSSALSIACGLEMATTAEGVETMEQFALLRIAGVTTVQGYLVGRPMPAVKLTFAPFRAEGSNVNAA